MADDTVQIGNVARERAFSDFDISFRNNPVTLDVSIKRQEEAIKQAVLNILLTSFDERPFEPNFGGNIRAYLFEPFDVITKSIIIEEIERTIEAFEPRVRVQQVDIQDDVDRNALTFKVVIEIISPFTSTTEITFTVQRQR